MAHSAPVSGRTTGRTTGRAGTGTGSWQRRSLNLFSDRAHTVGRWAVPLAIGLVYGYWAAANARHGGPITAGNLVLGFVTVIVFTVAMAAVLYLAPRLPREWHAFAWFLFSGAAFGFLVGQTGHFDARWLVGVSAGIGAIIGLLVFYWTYTHEDAEGHRIN
ncbi:hypothetical protein [Streptomyces similanensis]|uniref:Integral membrane protein n=1 Tax=Streptomyces similanensis TaxID=1274988 RepID=A0ABP9KI80_9ACTN